MRNAVAVVAVSRASVGTGVNEQPQEQEGPGVGDDSAQPTRQHDLGEERSATKEPDTPAVDERANLIPRRAAASSDDQGAANPTPQIYRRGPCLPVATLMLLVKGMAMPTLDAVLDWTVVLHWLDNGDTHWFANGVAINLVSGALSGLILVDILQTAVLREVPNFFGNWESMCLSICFCLSVVGMAPVVLAILVVYTGNLEMPAEQG